MTEAFSIIPAPPKAFFLIAFILLAILVPAAGFLGWTAYGSRAARFVVSPDGLHLRGDVWGRLIPASELLGGAARIVNLDTLPAYQPTRRTMGTGLPGYAAGWFRLRNGEKALLFLTDRRQAVYVPTRAGYAVLLSPENPARLVAALKRVAPADH